ncbi:D-alanyl-D-alanine carboxypeptidase/D-alanyl-D-alanine endopeptidase [Pseudonocardia nigra]|uniref:D-alanyl-D-alanine carboxypeptidase/D-alanyl-D-alanine endopeptidase n=1 Tax=Pseudonocardia nigra TaxID=1921578 RepID=UPI001C5D8989|nr:D-alanyl-D-alanine carboxypeptidase/D-alanyl-D-alanine-endopeptidase [Pseudonocardia nigra]
MGFGRRIGDTLRVPGRGARRALTVLVVLAVAGGAGSAVALHAPTLVTDLGLVEPTAPPPPPAPQPVLRALAADAPLPTTAGLSEALDDAVEEMPGSFSGVVVDPASGTALWQSDPERALVPGSTTKLLTAAAALLTLNPTDRFVTRAVEGPDPGTVVLVGGGDPTLSTMPEGEESVYPDVPRLADLAAEVREEAQGPIERVLVDTSRYSGPGMAEGWVREDIAAGYITPIEPLMVDGGRIDPTLQNGTRVDDPALAAGRALAEELGVDPDAVEEGTAEPGASTLGAVGSAPVAELVEHLIRSSDNVLGETLAREVAIARDGEPTFEGAAEHTVAALAQAGFDPSGAELHDGSGLSTENVIPAGLLGSLLAAAAAPQGPDDTQFLRPIITGLPVAGGSGTLDDRFGRDAASAGGRGVVRAKTGTLTGLSSLAGVVTDADGRLLVFAFVSNGPSPATSRPRLDAMAAELSECGCR